MGCGASCAQRAGRVLNGVTGVGSLGRIADLHDEFTIGQKLGDGAFATAYRGVRKADGCEVAIKTLDRTHPRFEHSLISAEIMVMRKVTHERCIRLIDVLEDASAVHLVEEVASGGELFDRICSKGHLTEKDAAYMIREVLEGLAHMHSQGAIHRDLKPENLLLMSANRGEEGYLEIKIADFGLSYVDDKGRSLKAICGTPDYIAPEMITCARRGNETYDAKVDVWSVGVILYVMICGFQPFFSQSEKTLLQLVEAGQFSFPSPEWDHVSTGAKEFVSLLLTKDPAQRPSAREALEHKWIKQELSKHKTDALNNTNLHQYWQSRRARKHIQAVLSIKKMERALLMRNLNTSNPLSQRHSTMDEIEPAAEEQNQMPAAQMEPSIAVLDTAKALPGTPGTRSDSKDITSDIGHSAGSERAELNKSNSLVSTSSRVSADNGHSASRARPDLNKSDSLVSTSSRVSV